MAAQALLRNSSISVFDSSWICRDYGAILQNHCLCRPNSVGNRGGVKISVRCSGNGPQTLRTCRNCKAQFDPLLNHPRACRYHTAHFGGETKRKFESVYTGGTMDTPNSGKILQYWHCCGSEDPFDPGCTSSPHASYDD
ncbi:uncharacterized protein LOC127242452 [Andrographis paniculata]|uniref:uncharacterized protein LOC127242452 n=1 Tax=Andrographis paniculata TaxID=175694 RepID=UPI0021E99950|nr:uncharacterized protein LOC127242452 [Andrographis paniculata]